MDAIFLIGFFLVMVMGGALLFGPILAAFVVACLVPIRFVRVACVLIAGYWVAALIYEWPPFYNCRCEPEPCAFCGGGAPG